MPKSIFIPGGEYYDDAHNRFIYTKDQTIVIEHSLLSIAKWESRWCKPFISYANKTPEEALDYIRCMTINGNVDSYVYYALSPEQQKEISAYIESPQSGANPPKSRSRGQYKNSASSEEIYSWMVELGIPFSCEKWHLNRLLNLIAFVSAANQPAKKMAKTDIFAENKRINEYNRRKFHSKG